MRGTSPAPAAVLVACLVVAAPSAGARLRRADSEAHGRGVQRLRFVDATTTAGVGYRYRFDGGGQAAEAAAGIAAGDVDGDGWVDLVVVRGDAGPPLLLHNGGDGTFSEMATGLSEIGREAMGPALADFSGDGALDLALGALKPGRPRLFLGGGSGAMEPVGGAFREAPGSPLLTPKNTFSQAFADIDHDGDLDLAMSHWDEDCRQGCGGDHVWLNDGGGRFTPAGGAWELPGYEEDFSFTPNFADIDGDGWPDLLVAADLNSSRVFHNDRGRGFVEITDRNVITDHYGMGAAIGDYDNDGDLDWFVTSNENGDADDGNRLYENRGDGTFRDVTSSAGVRSGKWGWGACFADFDNDGDLDLFHVNGWRVRRDRSRLFLNRGDKRFRESSRRVGLVDRDSGRGVACFDYDRDGDVDLFVSNHRGSVHLYRNEGGNRRNFLGIRLYQDGGNRQGVGARVLIKTRAGTQLRELRCGSNFVSQDPVEAHFGLGTATAARVTIVWPDGMIQRLGRVAANRWLLVRRERS